MRRAGTSGNTRKKQKTENGRANKDEREVVLLALLSHEKNNTFSNVLVKRTLDACGEMRPEERAFIKRLLEGVIERRTQLDAVITRFTGRPVTKLHPVVHQILRMGIYQIYYMDAVPDSAACNEAVRLARRHAPARLSSFVNGVLRNVAREKDAQAKKAAPALEAHGPDLMKCTRGTDPLVHFETKSGAPKAPASRISEAKTCLREPNRHGSVCKSDIPAHKTAGTEEANRHGSVCKSGIPAHKTAGIEEEGKSRIRDLEERYSMPAWIITMWEAQLGQEQTEALLASLLEIRPVCARFCRPGCGEDSAENAAAASAEMSASTETSAGKSAAHSAGASTESSAEDSAGASTETFAEDSSAGCTEDSAQERSGAARGHLIRQLREAGAVVEEGRWLPDSFRLRRTADLRKLPGFSDGLWTVQDESSMLAVTAAGLRGEETVFDVCAAPGGKTFLAAQMLQKGGRVFAYDLTRRKTDRIREGAARLRLSNIVVQERDARIFFPEDGEKADVLLCDLPCSGLGVIGKKRDIKYRASREGILELQALQREILRNAVRYLKKGGILVYSTCTISSAENEDNAAWIEKTLGLHPEDLAPFLPAGLPGLQGSRLQLLPHIHGTDGFFMARFRKL